MSNRSSQELVHLQSDRAKVARVTFFSTGAATLALGLHILLLPEFSNIELLSQLLFGIGSVVIAFASKAVAGSVELKLTEKYLEVKRGFGFLRDRGERVLLKNIHTVRLVDTKRGRNFSPTHLFVIYRAPEKKMVYAVTEISLIGIRDPQPFIVALLDRTNVTIKVYQSGMADSLLTRAELEELIQSA
ncbi:MAG: hypothetical protein KDD67_10185 [Ignavibacteriae bacterium]|nr:hypothetical protein [Ignavibacteriota bacterium]MCB9214796.1 hypothetical protein [Ignavibacteria bacterium]